MSQILLSSNPNPDFTPCEVHRHASGQFSIVIDGYRFYLPECHSFHNVLEHLLIFSEALDHGIRLVDYSTNFGNDDYLFYDPSKENDVPL